MYNSPHHPDFVPHITHLHDMCRARQMRYSLHYDESQDMWYVNLYSAAPSECHTGQDHMLCFALEATIAHLAGISVCK